MSGVSVPSAIPPCKGCNRAAPCLLGSLTLLFYVNEDPKETVCTHTLPTHVPITTMGHSTAPKPPCRVKPPVVLYSKGRSVLLNWEQTVTAHSADVTVCFQHAAKNVYTITSLSLHRQILSTRNKRALSEPPTRLLCISHALPMDFRFNRRTPHRGSN